MYQACIIIVTILHYLVSFATGQCPSKSLIEPCLCVENNLSYTSTIPIRANSIVCEHIQNSSFDLRSIFIKLHTTHLNDFLLYNTQITHLSRNLFGNLTFSTIILNNNPSLTSMDVDIFVGTQNNIEVFKTLNTSLSDSNTLFTIIRGFDNLRFISMENDQLKSIPDYAFNHAYLEYIWLGVPCTKTIQPISSIGRYPFYNVPNLHSLRIFSPALTQINKYSFAMSRRTILYSHDVNQILHISVGGLMLNASSFEATSLTRFRHRQVFLRIYNTSIDYLDEKIFQPFLATHSSSLLDVQDSNISRICDYRSLWIKQEFCTDMKCNDNRVYGTACFSL